MTRFELKKIFSRRQNQIALLLVFAFVVFNCWSAVHGVSFVDEAGKTHNGPVAAAGLRAAQKEWAGPLDTEKLMRAVALNREIAQSPEYFSLDETQQAIVFARGQGIFEIRHLLNYAFADTFRGYNYFAADELTPENAPDFYPNRVRLLKGYLSGDAADTFSEQEKAYLIEQYEALPTPILYDYTKGWTQILTYAQSVAMFTMLLACYLAAGIFSGEFSCKADAVFFSAVYGRDRAVAAKLKAGIWTVTGLYFSAMLLFSGVVLALLGADGWACPVQLQHWFSFYNLTMGQAFLLVLFGGYIGCLFMALLTMLISAKTRSAVTAVLTPLALIFLSSFVAALVGTSNMPLLDKLLALLPDQLLQLGQVIRYFHLYTLGSHVVGALPILVVVYTALTLVCAPAIYVCYRRQQAG